MLNLRGDFLGPKHYLTIWEVLLHFRCCEAYTEQNGTELNLT